MIILVLRGEVAMSRTVVEILQGVDIRLSISGDWLDRMHHQDALINQKIVVSPNNIAYPRLFVAQGGVTEFAAYAVTDTMARQAIELNSALAKRARLQEAER
ncbi:MAG: hypothetical protein WCT29_00640 [Candidatus Paceibacterota bacterium]|jgi:hypothetical protein